MISMGTVIRLGAVAAGIAIAACATRATDIGAEGAVRVVNETLASEGRDPSEYKTKVEEQVELGQRCYCVSVWPREYENPGWERYLVDPATGRILGRAFVD